MINENAKKMEKKFDLFYGDSVFTNKLNFKQTTWSNFISLKNFSKPPRVPQTQEQYQTLSKTARLQLKNNTYFINCTMRKPERVHTNIDKINFITIDIEKQEPNITFSFITKQLKSLPYSYLVHSTFSDTPKDFRAHVIIPSDGVDPEKYPLAVSSLSKAIGLSFLPAESLVPHQPMFFPKLLKDSEYKLGYYDQGRLFIDSDIQVNTQIKESINRASRHLKTTPSDFLLHIKAPVKACTPEFIKEALSKIDPDCIYPDWVLIAAALRHQFQKTPNKGYYLFDAWSASGRKYAGQHDTYRTYFSLKDNTVDRDPVTIHSLIYIAKQNGFKKSLPVFQYEPPPVVKSIGPPRS